MTTKNGPTIQSRASCWIFREKTTPYFLHPTTVLTIHQFSHVILDLRTVYKTTSLTHDLPLTPTVVVWVICHMLPDSVKPPFVIFDIRALCRCLMVSLTSQQQSTPSLCSKGLCEWFPTKPMKTKQQSAFWLLNQSERMSATYVAGV